MSIYMHHVSNSINNTIFLPMLLFYNLFARRLYTMKCPGSVEGGYIVCTLIETLAEITIHVRCKMAIIVMALSARFQTHCPSYIPKSRSQATATPTGKEERQNVGVVVTKLTSSYVSASRPCESVLYVMYGWFFILRNDGTGMSSAGRF